MGSNNKIMSNVATFFVGDTANQDIINYGVILETDAQITLDGSNTYYEIGALIVQTQSSNAIVNAQGTLDALVVNTDSNTTTLYVSNVSGVFTTTGVANITGIQARSFNIDIIQRMTINFVTNPFFNTGSFETNEVITDSNTGANGIIVGANSSAIDVLDSSGTFYVDDFIIGGTSNASAKIITLTNTAFGVGNTIAQESQVLQLANIQSFSNTGSFQIGELVYQNRKSNGATQNTLVGIIDSANSKIAIMSSSFGSFTNNAPLFGTSVTTTILLITQAGPFEVGEVVYQSNGSANVSMGVIQSLDLSIGAGTITIANVSGTFVTSYQVEGFVSHANGTVLIVSNGYCVAYINGVKPTNTATGVVYFSNSSVLELTEVDGIFVLYHKIYGANSYANLVSARSPISNSSVIFGAINTITLAKEEGTFIITTNSNTELIDANTGAIANIIAIEVTEN